VERGDAIVSLYIQKVENWQKQGVVAAAKRAVFEQLKGGHLAQERSIPELTKEVTRSPLRRIATNGGVAVLIW
jgi:hypothetical protein